jgi:hypothetical protein
MAEPSPPDARWPRYSSRALPDRRYVPGRGPHPRRLTANRESETPDPGPPERWCESEAFRFGVDLYNFAYWWESHEIFEEFLRATRRGSREDELLRALVQLAAANLQRFTRREAGARRLARRAAERLMKLSGVVLGVDAPILARAVRDHFEHGASGPVRIRLVGGVKGNEIG